MNYVLDTNILLIYLRDKETRKYIEEQYDPFGKDNNPIISVVSLGEIRSIALRNKWGQPRINRLIKILSKLIITDINAEDVIDSYAEIDTFSQGKLVSKPLNMSARNMGKNDLWIAATTDVLKATLLTTDKDFDHLGQNYISLESIDIQKKQ